MPMRDRLARLVQRSPARLTLRERAASLKVSAAKVMHKRPPMPEPNSEEAKAAFKTACTLSDKLAHAAVHGYPELNRPDGSSWTRDSLWKALESGELPAAEVAHLYRLAGERELRIDAAAVRANVGALHVLAFADSWPFPEEEPGNDPVFRRIAEHRAAYEAWSPLAAEVNSTPLNDPRYLDLEAACDPYSRRETAALEALLNEPPVTSAGLAALAKYLPAALRKVDASAFDDSPGKALDLVCGAVRLILSSPGEADPANPALLEMVGEWVRLRATLDAGAHSDEEAAPVQDRWADLERAIYLFPCACVADLAAKLPVFEEESEHAKRGGKHNPAELSGAFWVGFLRDLKALGEGAAPSPVQHTSGIAEAFLGALDLRTLDLQCLSGLCEDAEALARVAWGMTALPRQSKEGALTPVGRFFEAVACAAGEIVWRSQKEAKARTPANAIELEWRFKAIAGPVLEDGNADELEALAADLLKEAARVRGLEAEAETARG